MQGALLWVGSFAETTSSRISEERKIMFLSVARLKLLGTPFVSSFFVAAEVFVATATTEYIFLLCPSEEATSVLSVFTNE